MGLCSQMKMMVFLQVGAHLVDYQSVLKLRSTKLLVQLLPPMQQIPLLRSLYSPRLRPRRQIQQTQQ